MKTIIASLILLLSSTAQAMTVESYQRQYKEIPEAITTYVHGLGNGYTNFQSYYQAANIPLEKTFCLPPSLALNGENFVQLLNEEIKRSIADVGNAKTSQYTVELLLLLGMNDTFPCR